MRAFLLVVALLGSTKGDIEVDQEVLDMLSKGSNMNIFVSFEAADILPNLREIVLKEANRESRIKCIVETLKKDATDTQGALRSWLEGRSSNEFTEFKQFWITNKVYVKDVTAGLVEEISKLPYVKKIELERVAPIAKTEDFNTLKIDINKQAQLLGEKEDEIVRVLGHEGLTWGLEKMRVRHVWEMNLGSRGSGIRVGGIDTGVDIKHEALSGNFVGDHGWYDPLQRTESPCDTHGHGTHTMGTAVGMATIGVAPEARWMACRACDNGGCSDVHLLTCGEFMLSPTRPNGTDVDFSSVPHVIINSWGVIRTVNNRFFDRMIEIWFISGIIPIFGNGNAGPDCQTTTSPADHPLAISVGNATRVDGLRRSSSKGPSVIGVMSYIKPDLSAPGTDIISALANATEHPYSMQSGTSMACAHVAGVAALLLSYKPTLNVDQVKHYLCYGNQQDLYTEGYKCGGISDDKFPNNSFGSGRIDAPNSYQKLLTDHPPISAGRGIG